MSVLTKASIFAFAVAAAVTTVTAAVAETQWDRNHPRREQVNDRLQNQNRRINQEVREGEITKGQANQLHAVLRKPLSPRQ